MDNVVAMVLAGGRVDELLSLTEKRPKSALPIFGIYRIIDFALSNLMHSGIPNAGVLSQYRPYALVRHIGTGEHWDFIGRKRGIRILSPYRGAKASDWYKGTADAVYQNISYIEEFNPEYVLVISADHIYHMNYRQVFQFHVEKKADVTICFTQAKKKTSRFGYGVIDKNDRLVAYQEKPEVPQSNWISMTVYLFKTALLIDCLNTNAREKSHEFGRDIIPRLIQDKRIFGYRFNDYWAYARTIASYYETNMDLLKRKINLDMWQVRTNLSERCGDRDRLPAYIGGHVSNAIISEGCSIRGSVQNSILSPGVFVAPGAEVIGSIIFHDTKIEPRAIVTKVICDKDCHIGEGSVIGGYGDSENSGITLLGKNTIIPPKTVRNAKNVTPSSENRHRQGEEQL
ncbi:hypothetical protein AMJ52_08900 [candidate division TA06 bacterium DG_78]|uniref:Uncharacterized protein n=1 Tax=candidate division TA06 bacterium DG_78 TaxID=1703772 RepID=A0A0S7YAR0_UNCT6|nr:MAG: hypothetical protein AMJ52_08900 [candidate division TA06 bacterium DG_78]